MFTGRYAKYLLPGVLFQSTLIGGGYASGREVVEFGGRFGPLGWLSILVIVAGFALICALAFEFARITKAYDYHSFIRALIGSAWWLFDILFIAMAVLVIAIVSAATGEVAQDTLGVPYFVAVTVVIVAVGAIILGGGRVIETFKTIGTGLLYVTFAFFGVLVLARFWPGVQAIFAVGDQLGETPGSALFSGVQYVSYNLVVLPAAFFALYRQTRRSEALAGGLAAGLLGSIPFVITYLCLMAFYPNEAVMGAEVPWLAMLNQVGGPLLVGVYAIVVLWTLVETATGLIHAIMNRINVALEAGDRTPLGGPQSATITIVVLAAAVALAQFGIIALVAQGYGAMAYGFFILFALPLLTVGVYKIWKAPAVTPAEEVDQSKAVAD